MGDQPMLPDISPEEDLIRECTRRQLGAREGELTIRQQSIDGNEVYDLARRHGVLPLVYRELKSADVSPVTASAFDSLREETEAIAQRNLHAVNVLDDLIERFNSASIPVRVIKGPVLSAITYGDIASRQFADLDLLIPRKDLRKAESILKDERFSPKRDHTPSQARVDEKVSVEREFFRSTDGMWIDLHWQPIQRRFPSPISQDDLFKAKKIVQVANRDIPTLSAQNSLLLHTLHGTKHCWPRLEWVADIVGLSQSELLDWPELIARSKSAGTFRAFSLGLCLADAIFDQNLSTEITTEIPKSIADLTKQSLAWLWSDIFGAGDIGIPERIPFHLMALDRWPDRLRYLIRLGFYPAPVDLEQLALPPALFPLYHVYTPTRIGLEYGPAAFRWTSDKFRSLGRG